MPRKIWNKEKMEKAIRDFVRENGRFPTNKEMDTLHYLPSRSIFKKHFGMTYSDWRQKAGDQYSYIDKKFRVMTNAELKKWLKQRLQEMGTTYIKEYEKKRNRNEPSATFWRARFNWDELMKELGLRDETYYSKDLTISKFNDYYRTLGYTPSSNEVRQHDKKLFNSILHHFEKYNRFLDHLGLQYVRDYEHVNKSDDELLEDYLTLCNSLGKLATLKDIRNCKWTVSPETYLTRFGSIQEVRKKLGLDEGIIQRRIYSRKLLEMKIKRIIEEYGENMSVKEFYKLIGCSKATLAKYFNTTSVRKIINNVSNKK